MTITEIAKEAGVSIATVSRVLNNGSVSPATRSIVEEVINKHKFNANVQARALIKNKSKVIGVISHGITNYFHTEFIEVLEKVYSDQNTLLFICLCQWDNQVKSEQKNLEALVERKVDGVIMHDPTPENYTSGFLSATAAKIPMVIVESFNAGNDLNTVDIDQAYGMQLVMRHLMELGHTDIMFVRGSFGYTFQIKEDIWRKVLTDAGTPPPPDNLVVIPQGNTEIGLVQTETVLLERFKSGKIPTAIFACNDIMAIGALNAARKSNLRVPEDISIIGHDNSILSETNQLTSVTMNTNSVARSAIDLLAHAMDDVDPVPRRIIIAPQLVLRSTSGVVRS
jgi:DNA-binding LacI/PurR family transcriptional regulator